MKNFDEKKDVILKKSPTSIAMRIFREYENFENQVMKECENFYSKFGEYPNAIVANPNTFDKWESSIEANLLDDDESFYENLTFSEIKKLQEEKYICEFCPSADKKATIFKTEKYELFLIENEEYQEDVYQLFNGYSPLLENGKFTYPIIDMKSTAENIKKLMKKSQITPSQMQQVCGLGSLQAVYKWLEGKSVPTIDNLGIISNLLNVLIDDIVVFRNRED
jgi:hypothetical protein